ncbi:hypothetical protein HH212_08480 [Massilia forsythiae]|uniref:DUF3304 domain-containing protein n=1 Tax=Massilia forsythiae TaxID=2728020 RepID=A0A7Z2VVN4_9BURK|nr:hypothetical protein [Massilia forsythiae]QJE00059.1 hypothetical protein HH212_08480 [Massilia forsythiae]
MRKLTINMCVLACLAAAGCTSVPVDLRDTVVLHYQHVANVHRIDFSSPVMLPHRHLPVESVAPLASQGFWAVFLLCGVDVTGAGVPSFYFDVDRFRVRAGRQRFGPLRPYTLRLDDSADLNSRFDTRVIADAVAMEIQEGPSSQVFRHGYYPRLDYRFAIYVPHALPDYAGDELTLRYEGGRTMVLGNGYPPSDIPVAGLGAMGIASHCLP